MVFFLVFFALLHVLPSYSMLPTVARQSISRVHLPLHKAFPVKSTPTIQKRGLLTTEQLKGTYEGLTAQAKAVSLPHGASMYASGILQKMYSLKESEVPTVQLIQALFFQQESQFKPTALKSNAAYSLDCSILGFIIGALETDKLQDSQERKFIIEQWRLAHKNSTGDKISIKKIEDLITLMLNAYQYDKNTTRAILLSFLYAKGDPDSNHDIIHYLSSLNQYITIFEKKVEVQKKDGLTIKEVLKNYFARLFKEKKTDYEQFKNQLQQYSGKEQIALATENFGVAISAILTINRDTNIYPEAVIQSGYNYKNRGIVPNCVETAMQDLCNILLYNTITQSFDLSLLPSTIIVNPLFKDFYDQYGSIQMINSPKTGQAFMNLVSEVSGVRYSSDGYELQGSAVEPNLVTLYNYFFGIQAQNLDELGTALSDENRTISFVLQETDKKNHKKIVINVVTHQQYKKPLVVEFWFTAGHGYLKVPVRDAQKGFSLLDSFSLAEQYTISQEAQSLFHAQSSAMSALLLRYIPHAIPISMYYMIPLRDNIDRKIVIEHILKFGGTNKEATEYAYSIYESLSNEEKREMSALLIILEAAEKNQKFKTIYTDFKDFYMTLTENNKIMLTSNIVQSITSNTDRSTINFIMNHVKDVYPELADTDNKKIMLTSDIVKSITSNTDRSTINFIMNHLKDVYPGLTDDAEKFMLIVTTLEVLSKATKLTIDIIEELFELIKNHPDKNAYLAEVLRILSSKKHSNINITVLVKRLINKGVTYKDTNISPFRKYTPIQWAVLMDDIPLINLLLQNRADLTQNSNKYTTLQLAVEEASINAIKLLLENGADPNQKNSRGETALDTAFELKNYNEEADVDSIVKLLKGYGGVTNVSSIVYPSMQDEKIIRLRSTE